jgi:hypothetical protein
MWSVFVVIGFRSLALNQSVAEGNGWSGCE